MDTFQWLEKSANVNTFIYLKEELLKNVHMGIKLDKIIENPG